jgi:hypothetical protein
MGRDEALDLLMLTQGWRKYVWNEENLKKSKEPKKQIISDGIKGKVITTKKLLKTQQEQGFVMAFSPIKNMENVIIPADSDGEFTVSAEYLKACKGDYVYLKPLAPPKSVADFKLADPFEIVNRSMRSDQIVYPLGSATDLKGEPAVEPSLRSKVTVIKGVTIRGYKPNTVHRKYVGMMGELDSIARIENTPNDYVCHYNVLNCPRHVHGVGETKPREGFRYLVVYNYDTPTERYVEIIYHVPPRPLFTEEELLKMNHLTRVKAYYPNREFYKPDYDKEVGDSEVPDYRNTLLWEPSVITDEKGEATLSFFCSDINTDFVGRIEGAGGEGLLGSSYFKITVRKLKTEP